MPVGSKRACVLLCLLALVAALAALALGLRGSSDWQRQKTNSPTVPSAGHESQSPRHTATSAPAPPAAVQNSALPSGEEYGSRWGGALNSAQPDGAGFFDHGRARVFIAAVEPENQKYIVELNARSFLPLPGAANLAAVFPDSVPPADETPAKDRPEQRTAYLQFLEHPNAEERARLESAGIALLSYVSGYAWSARGTKEAFAAALQLACVRAVARIDPRDKLQAQVFQGRTPPHARTASGQARLWLILQPGTAPAELAAQLASAPALAVLAPRAVHPSVLGPRFEIAAAVALAPRIAALDAAAFVEFVPPPAASRDATTDVESNIGSVRGDNLPLLNGSGVKVAVRELGNISLHVDFAEPPQCHLRERLRRQRQR